MYVLQLNKKFKIIILPPSKNVPDTTKFNMSQNKPQIQNTVSLDSFKFSLLIVSISQNCL